MAENQLTFKRYHVWEVVVPARADIISAPSKGRVYSGSTAWPEVPIHLIEGVTSAGFTAVGECDRGTPRAKVEATLRGLLGQNLATMTPSTAWMGVGELPQSYPLWSWEMAGDRAYEILETLWLDAMGKASGLPAHALLGGAVRKAVLTAFWANRPAAPTLLALIGEAKERGLRGIKIKSDSTGDTARALVELGNDLPADFVVTIDPMNAWRSLRESARWFEALAKLPCTIQIEDPFPYLVVEDWRSARQFRPLSIVCHARSEDIFRNALRLEMADGYNLGGWSAYGFLHQAHVAEFYGKDCWQGSSLEMGVLQHLRLHVAACARNCMLASDLQSEWVREHTLITPHMQYADGYALVPDRPGLGVELDHDTVSRYCRQMFEVA